MNEIKITTKEETKTVEITQTFFSYHFQNKGGSRTIREGFRTHKKMMAEIDKNFKDYEVKIENDEL